MGISRKLYDTIGVEHDATHDEIRAGFPNPIGDDAGDEFKYSAETDND